MSNILHSCIKLQLLYPFIVLFFFVYIFVLLCIIVNSIFALYAVLSHSTCLLLYLYFILSRLLFDVLHLSKFLLCENLLGNKKLIPQCKMGKGKF